jgi:hypothetical protein
MSGRKGFGTFAYNGVYSFYFLSYRLDNMFPLVAFSVGQPYSSRGVCGEKALDSVECVVLFPCCSDELVVLQADAVFDAFVAVELCF